MMLWIQHGVIHPMTGAAPFAADIQIEDGRILKLVPPDAHAAKASLLDAAGLHIWPGFLDPRTHLGLTEDHPERPDPSDTAFAQAAAAGVTAVAVCPAPSVPAPRKCSFWQTGRVPEPINAPETFIYPMEGMTEAALRHALAEAKEQQQRIRLVACTLSELALALRLHAELGGDVALEHRAASDALLPELAAGGMPIILSVARSRGEQSVYGLAAQLMRLGAVVALSTDHPTARIHHLPLCAGLCLRFGAEEEAAMATITRNAAQAMGLEASRGCIAPGYAADLTLLDGSPLRLATAVRYTLAEGKIVYQR